MNIEIKCTCGATFSVQATAPGGMIVFSDIVDAAKEFIATHKACCSVTPSVEER